MNGFMNDLLDRVDTLENAVYQLQKTIKSSNINNIRLQILNKTINFTEQGAFVCGTVSASNETKIYVLCRVLCSNSANIFLKCENDTLSSFSVSGGTICELVLLGGTCVGDKNISLVISDCTGGGSIQDIVVILDKNATFIETAS